MTSTSPKWPRNTLFVLQGLQLLSLPPWLMMAGLSFMVFDAPGSEKNQMLWAFVATMWSYPVWLLLAAVASWILLAKFRRHVAAVVIAAIFSLPAIGLLLWVLLMVGVSRLG